MKCWTFHHLWTTSLRMKYIILPSNLFIQLLLLLFLVKVTLVTATCTHTHIHTFTQVSNPFPDISTLSQSYDFLHTPVLQHNKTVDFKVTGSETSDPSPFTCSLTPTSSQGGAGISWLFLTNVLESGETLKSVEQVVHLDQGWNLVLYTTADTISCR